MDSRNCEECGGEYAPRNGRQKRCGAEACDRAARTRKYLKHDIKRGRTKVPAGTVLPCELCGREFEKLAGPQKYCSPKCADAVLARQKKDHQMKTVYGITVDEYEDMYGDCGGCCHICECEFEVLHVDHCHKGGQVRGLLCFNCNTSIGKLGDNLEGVLRACLYLTRDFVENADDGSGPSEETRQLVRSISAALPPTRPAGRSTGLDYGGA